MVQLELVVVVQGAIQSDVAMWSALVRASTAPLARAGDRDADLASAGRVWRQSGTARASMSARSGWSG